MIRKTEEYKPEYLDQALDVIENGYAPMDGFTFYMGDYNGKKPEWGPLGNIIERSVNECLTLFGSRYSSIWLECWVNVTRPKPRQIYNRHNHVNISKAKGLPIPNYTWIYYLQMPDNVVGKESMLNVRDTIDYLPTVGELIILNGDDYHSVYEAPNSTVNRIVLAGNVAIRYNKTTKTLM